MRLQPPFLKLQPINRYYLARITEILFFITSDVRESQFEKSEAPWSIDASHQNVSPKGPNM